MTTNSKFNSEKERRNEIFLSELIERAESGDSVAAREVLDEIASDLLRKQLRPALRMYLTQNLLLFLDQGVPLMTALGLDAHQEKLGRPKKYVDEEIMAVDLLLRDHAGFAAESAARWIGNELGPDRRLVQRLRKLFDSRYAADVLEPLMESRSRDDLLHLAGSMRKKVGELFPHI